MTNEETASGSRNEKDGQPLGGGFLTKASQTLRRSPSKKHQAKQSNPMPVLDGVLLENALANANVSPSRNGASQYRPTFRRAPSTPLDLQAIQYALNSQKDEKPAQSAIDTTMTGGHVANGGRRDPSSALSKPIVAIPSQDANLLPAGNVVGSGAQPAGSASLHNPSTIYHHIHDMASKRISTLDYMRKAHEGRVYWFNTVHFSRSDLSRFHNFAPARLSRRATNYLLLGLSIPAVLDVHSPHASGQSKPSAVHDFLRNLNSLLGEFESFQQNHPPDGSSASSLSRTRIPHMFKRATQATTGRNKRSNSGVGAEIGLPLQQTSSAMPGQPGSAGDTAYHHSAHASIDTSVSSNSYSSSASTLVSPAPGSAISPPTSSFHSSYSSVPTSFPHDLHPNSLLLPNEGPYAYLLTPPLPFAPDFYSVFATLCDILIDTYQRIIQMVSNPSVCTVAVGEVFAKADARLRKVIIGGVIKEFEGAARETGKREILGVQKVVLGGLMGG